MFVTLVSTDLLQDEILAVSIEQLLTNSLWPDSCKNRHKPVAFISKI